MPRCWALRQPRLLGRRFVASPLSGALAAQIYKGMKALFLDATLTRDTIPTTSPDYDPQDPPAPTSTSYTCKAIVEKYAERMRLEGLVNQKDRKVLILANSLSVTPRVNDRVTISGVTFLVMLVETDPATAVWTLQGRMS